MKRMRAGVAAVLFVLLIGIVSCAGPERTTDPPTERPAQLVERVIEVLPPPLPKYPYLKLSADGRKWAYKYHDKQGNRVIHNGKEGPAYENIGLLALSRDGERIAYRVERKGPPFRAFVVCDDKEGPRFDHVSHLVFSPDGKHLAYPAVLNRDWFIVKDGKVGPAYDRVSGPVCSPDSRRMAYAAKRGDEWVVVVDGVEQRGDYDSAWVVAFSPDSAHVLWTATREDKGFLVIDGVEGPPHEKLELHERGPDEPRFIVVDGGKVRLLSVAWPADAALRMGGPFERLTEPLGTLPPGGEIRQISPDEKTCVFVQRHDTGRTIFLGDRKLGTWDSTDYKVNFSPDGEHVWFEAQRAGQWYIVWDDKELPIHGKGAARLTLSPGGKRYALACRRDGKWRIVLDGVEGPAYDRMSCWGTFSPDGRRFAHGAGRGDENFLVLDGKELKKYSGGCPMCRGVYNITFSPDSRHVAYGVIHGDGHHVTVCLDDEEIWEGREGEVPYLVFSPDGKLAFCDGGLLWCDGRTSRTYDRVSYLRFSPDGRHLASIARRDKKEFLVVDGLAGPAHDEVECPPKPHRISTATGVRYIVRDGDRRTLVEVDWPADRDWTNGMTPPKPD